MFFCPLDVLEALYNKNKCSFTQKDEEVNIFYNAKKEKSIMMMFLLSDMRIGTKNDLFFMSLTFN